MERPRHWYVFQYVHEPFLKTSCSSQIECNLCECAKRMTQRLYLGSAHAIQGKLICFSFCLPAIGMSCAHGLAETVLSDLCHNPNTNQIKIFTKLIYFLLQQDIISTDPILSYVDQMQTCIQSVLFEKLNKSSVKQLSLVFLIDYHILGLKVF